MSKPFVFIKKRDSNYLLNKCGKSLMQICFGTHDTCFKVIIKQAGCLYHWKLELIW